MTGPDSPGPSATTSAYLAAVEAELADLSAEERGDLLEDLAGHLAAVEQEEGDVPLGVRLGPPERYAAELRVAAGLPPAVDVTDAGGRVRTALTADVRRIRHDWDRLRQTRAGREVTAFLPLLAPGWWVLRAYLAVFALSVLSGSGLRGALLLDVGLPVVGWALLAGAVVVSVRWGRGGLPEPRRKVLRLAEVALALWAGLLVFGGAPNGVQTVYVQDGAPLSADGQWPLLSTAGPVTDILPFSADGTPLEDVLLFDQDGRPLYVGEQQWWEDGCSRTPRPPLAADGVPVAFAYPQRYVADGYGSFDGEPTQQRCARNLPRPDVPLPDFPATVETPAAEEPAPQAPASEQATPPPVEQAPASGAAPTEPAPPAATPEPDPAATPEPDPAATPSG